MRQTVNKSQFRDAFSDMGRGDQFSYDALGLLFDYLEEVDEDFELDVIAICCDFSEDTVEEIASNYSIDLSEFDNVESDHDDKKEMVLEYLNEHTSVVGETKDGIVYQQF